MLECEVGREECRVRRRTMIQGHAQVPVPLMLADWKIPDAGAD